MNLARQGPASGSSPKRRAILAAVVEVFNARGYEQTSVEDLLGASGLDSFSFAGHFADKEDCFIATHNFLLASARARVQAAVPAEASWGVRLAAGLGMALALVEEDRAAARFLLSAQQNGPEALRGRSTAKLLGVEAFMAEGLKGKEGDVPAILGEALPGGAAFVIRGRLVASPVEPVADLYEGSLRFLALPYLGERAYAELIELEAPRFRPETIIAPEGSAPARIALT